MSVQSVGSVGAVDASGASGVSTEVTSDSAAALRRQENQLESEISELQKSGGSSREIEKYKTALQDVRQRLSEISNQSSSSAKPKTAEAPEKKITENVGRKLDVNA